jgi:hydroxyacylglutathione hydrolase
MLDIRRFVFNLFHENTYLVWNKFTRDAAVIDPGMNDEREKKVFNDFVLSNSITILHCINTHCHIDHVLGNNFIKQNYNSQLWIPNEDEFLLDLLVEQAKMFGLDIDDSPKPDQYLEGDSKIELGNIAGKTIFTPGHTPGEICLYFESERILFSGDVLFKDSIGRTDLWGGNLNTLLSSIKNKLFVLPDDVIVYPGHESATSIGYEKLNNPFFKD